MVETDRKIDQSRQSAEAARASLWDIAQRQIQREKANDAVDLLLAAHSLRRRRYQLKKGRPFEQLAYMRWRTSSNARLELNVLRDAAYAQVVSLREIDPSTKPLDLFWFAACGLFLEEVNRSRPLRGLIAAARPQSEQLVARSGRPRLMGDREELAWIYFVLGTKAKIYAERHGLGSQWSATLKRNIEQRLGDALALDREIKDSEVLSRAAVLEHSPPGTAVAVRNRLRRAKVRLAATHRLRLPTPRTGG